MKNRKLNWSICFCFVLVLTNFSCSDHQEVSPNAIGSSSNEMMNTIEVHEDPNAQYADNGNAGKTAAFGAIKKITVRLNREEFAVGNYILRLARAVDDKLIAKSPAMQVTNLMVHSETSRRYTKFTLNLSKELDPSVEYKIDMICDGCIAENKRRVNWWYSEDNDYAEGMMYTQRGIRQTNFDFSFNVVYETPDGDQYNCAFNNEKDDVYAFNFGDARVSQTFRIGTPIEFADDDLKREAQLNLGLTYDQPVMTYAALSLTEFRSAYTFVEDLSGIEYFRNLTTLQFHVSHLTNVDLLSNLTKLEHLDLRYNDIEDVRALGALTNLRYLNLEGNLLTDAEVRDLENVLGIDVIF